MAIPELRVHGVSGTPPRNMLYSDPVALPIPEDVTAESHKHVKVYIKPSDVEYGVGAKVEAFHWGGLTSGSMLSALWVLLLPFSMANVAGWAARSRRRGPVRIVRAFGLVLTGVFMNLAMFASIDFFWQWSAGSVPTWVEENRKALVAGLFLVVGWLWWGLVSWASTRSHFTPMSGADRRRLLWGPKPSSMLPADGGPEGEEAWADPAESEITEDLVWDVHAILHRLRRIHFGFGFMMLAFAAVVATDTGWQVPGWELFDWPTAVVLVMILLNFVTLLATGSGPTPSGPVVRWLTAVQPHLGVLALLGASVLLYLHDVETDSHWAHLRDTSTFLLIVSTASILLIWLAAGKVSASSATMGAFFGAVLGAAAAFSLSGLLGEESKQIEGLNWLAAGILVWLLILVCVVFWLILTHIDTKERKLWDAVHKVTGDLTTLWIWLPAVGLAVAGLAVWRRCAGGGPGESWFEACVQTGQLSKLPGIFGVLATTLAGLALLLAVSMFFRARMVGLGFGLLFGVPLGFVVLRITGVDFFGIDFSFTDVETAARTFAIALPAGLLVGRLVAGLKGGSEARRGFAVVWDVMMFWPRWFHPLAPPAYGPHAVKRLQQEIRRRARPTETGVPTCPLLVAAHSQGTIITLIALAGMAETRKRSDLKFETTKPGALDKLGLLTYGCPIDHLYNRYFPSAGFTVIAGALAENLDVYGSEPSKRRWVNLYRSTDPIGGPLLESLDVRIDDPVEVGGKKDYRKHSYYEPTSEFGDNRTDIESRLGKPC